MLQGECPITLCPVNELSNPVSFSSAPGHIYELNSLCDWLECCSKNPLTGEAVCIRDLVTLGNADQQLQSRGIMERRVLTITHNQVSLMAEMQPLVKMETSEYKVTIVFIIVSSHTNSFLVTGVSKRHKRDQGRHRATG